MRSFGFLSIAQSRKFFIFTSLLISIGLLLSVVVLSVSFLLVLHFLLLSTFLNSVEFKKNFFDDLYDLRVSVQVQFYWHVIFPRNRNLNSRSEEVFLSIPNIHIIAHKRTFNFFVLIFIVPNFW